MHIRQLLVAFPSDTQARHGNDPAAIQWCSEKVLGQSAPLTLYYFLGAAVGTLRILPPRAAAAGGP